MKWFTVDCARRAPVGYGISAGPAYALSCFTITVVLWVSGSTSSGRTSANLWLRKFLAYERGLSGYLSAMLPSLRLHVCAFMCALTRRSRASENVNLKIADCGKSRCDAQIHLFQLMYDLLFSVWIIVRRECEQTSYNGAFKLPGATRHSRMPIVANLLLCSSTTVSTLTKQRYNEMWHGGGDGGVDA